MKFRKPCLGKLFPDSVVALPVAGIRGERTNGTHLVVVIKDGDEVAEPVLSHLDVVVEEADVFVVLCEVESLVDSFDPFPVLKITDERDVLRKIPGIELEGSVIGGVIDEVEVALRGGSVTQDALQGGLQQGELIPCDADETGSFHDWDDLAIRALGFQSSRF